MCYDVMRNFFERFHQQRTNERTTKKPNKLKFKNNEAEIGKIFCFYFFFLYFFYIITIFFYIFFFYILPNFRQSFVSFVIIVIIMIIMIIINFFFKF